MKVVYFLTILVTIRFSNAAECHGKVIYRLGSDLAF